MLRIPIQTFLGLSQYNSITDLNCKAQKGIFKENDAFSKLGGLKAMGDAMEKGMALVMSIWDDHDAHMLWLDSSYPVDRIPSDAGVTRLGLPEGLVLLAMVFLQMLKITLDLPMSLILKSRLERLELLFKMEGF